MTIPRWRREVPGFSPDGMTLTMRFGEKTYTCSSDIYSAADHDTCRHQLSKLYDQLVRVAAKERFPETPEGDRK
jgi:hypothetical protein